MIASLQYAEENRGRNGSGSFAFLGLFFFGLIHLVLRILVASFFESIHERCHVLVFLHPIFMFAFTRCAIVVDSVRSVLNLPIVISPSLYSAILLAESEFVQTFIAYISISYGPSASGDSDSFSTSFTFHSDHLQFDYNKRRVRFCLVFPLIHIIAWFFIDNVSCKVYFTYR